MLSAQQLIRRASASALVASTLALATACSPASSAGAASQPAPSSAAAGGWQTLFDGSGLDNWRGFKRPDVPAAWRVENGTLAFVPVEGEGQRGDLISREQFRDFELELEWKVAPCANSGIIYRSTEQESTPWRTGPEMQVLDDSCHPDAKIPSHRAGALYDLIVPPQNITRPVGEWNTARVRVVGNHIQQWLNGQKTADVVVGSPEWNEMYGKSKFAPVPTFARQPAGHIVLQDHGDRVWFRNIRVRRLDGR